MKGSTQTLLLIIGISLILSTAASLAIYFCTFTSSKYPTLLAVRSGGNASTFVKPSEKDVFAYVSRETKIKYEHDKEKHAAAGIAGSNIDYVASSTSTPLQQVAHDTRPKDPFVADDLPDFKIKNIWVVFKPILDSEDTNTPFASSIALDKKIHYMQGLVLVANDKYPLQHLAKNIYDYLGKNPTAKEVDSKVMEGFQDTYDKDTKKKFVRYYAYNTSIHRRIPVKGKELKAPEEVFVPSKILDATASKGGSPDPNFHELVPIQNSLPNLDMNGINLNTDYIVMNDKEIKYFLYKVRDNAL